MPVEIDADMVVLATAMIPQDNVADLCKDYRYSLWQNTDSTMKLIRSWDRLKVLQPEFS